jgi:hypothetical protein
LHASILQNRNVSADVRRLMDQKQANEYKQHPGQVLDQNLVWVKADPAATCELLAPENDAERKIISEAEKLKLQVSVYTAGMYDKGKFVRVKGPAFVQTPTAKALSPDQISSWAAREYATDAKNYSGSVSGWNLYAERVFANEDRCVACHNSFTTASGKSIAPLKRGDAVGLFVLATRKR